MEIASVPPEGALLWQPGSESLVRSRMGRYIAWLAAERGIVHPGYPELWEWSTSNLEEFWNSIWDYFHVIGERGQGPALDRREMPGARWFPSAHLNYAENALRETAGMDVALIGESEVRPPMQLSGTALRHQVAGLAVHLREMGVGPGDRVAAYLPNIPEAVVAFLASASLGAIWSSCSPDFGERAVLDRFQQIQPKVLIAVDGYRYGGRDFDRRRQVARLRSQLPSVEAVVLVPYLNPRGSSPEFGWHLWVDLLDGADRVEFQPVDFDHPLWILYSSGTTGLPKPIVHSHGGILLEHLKVLALHADLGRGERSFWFSTTGWMMWNYLVGALLVGATPVLYDGSPVHPDPARLWELAAAEGVSHFGTSAAHIGAGIKAGIRPGRDYDLSAMRFLGSTGSPLSPSAFQWLYREVRSDLWVASLSGGTDLCTAFVLGCPGLPVRAGVIQCRGLGAKIEAFDGAGAPVVDEVGELVIREPMPSMPICFWGDPVGERYRASYFTTYPGVWRHGDWVRIRRDGGVVIYGRSDSTINRHGVRMGTSEIYRVVEELAEVEDSLVVDVARAGGDSQMLLFVRLAPGHSLDQALVERVRRTIRDQISPRHVPDVVRRVSAIPRTLSGKKLEIPIKRILEGTEAGVALDLDAVADPAALGPFLELAQASAKPGLS
ncbi:MAG: acetoacetate--CoA ligase [Candidatus Dormibacteria bacterium]